MDENYFVRFKVSLQYRENDVSNTIEVWERDDCNKLRVTGKNITVYDVDGEVIKEVSTELIVGIWCDGSNWFGDMIDNL